MRKEFQVISFDLDGTLVDDNFDRELWFQEIPRRYAEKRSLPLEAAKEQVLAEYKALEGHSRWTDMAFWFERFGLGDWQQAAMTLAPMIRLFPEALDVLEALRPRFRLIVITQAERKFLDLKLRVQNLGSYFEAVFATPNHFGKLSKDEEVFASILQELGIRATDMLHIGDHPRYDWEVPRALGIAALLLDRSGQQQGPDVIHDLRELLLRLAL